MEEQNLLSTNEEKTTSGLTISNTAINDLSETGKWTKFLSIIGFIFSGLIIIMGLFSGSIMSSIPNGQISNMFNGMGIIAGGMYILMGLLYFFPSWYLFKFSQKIKKALSTQNNNDLNLNAAFNNQKSFYKFWGILTIISIGIYVLLFLITLIVLVLN
jgi:hypothetical protein|tara:strand:- start:20683 stop:21156 length:474 start_codon:yes stop_codon:yes gene_type:complete